MRARIGQKNKIAGRWAKRVLQPCAQDSQRGASVYLFGAGRAARFATGLEERSVPERSVMSARRLGKS
jgi:hypothetical protein